MYVMGDKAGQKAYPPGAGPPPPQGPMGMNPQAMGMNQQGMNPQVMGMSPQTMGMNPQAIIAQQNNNMEALERRRERERARERSGSMGVVRFLSFPPWMCVEMIGDCSSGLVPLDWTTMTLQVGEAFALARLLSERCGLDEFEVI